MAEETPKARERRIARLREKHPDVNFDNEDDIFDYSEQEYDQQQEHIGLFKKREDQIRNLFMNNPRIAAIFVEASEAMNQGEDATEAFVLSMIRHYGADIKEYIDTGGEKILEADREYKSRSESGAKIEQQQAANIEKSQKDIDVFIQEKGLTDDEYDQFIDFFFVMLDKAFMGNLDKEMLEAVWKAYRYEDEIADAVETATIAGRNDAIDMKKKDKPKEVAPVVSSKTIAPKEEPMPSRGRHALSTLAKKKSF